MARMLFSTLNRAGYETFLASRYISYSKHHQLKYLETRKQGAKEEAKRLLGHWQQENIRPDLWFCYHPYDKSPDWLGMEVCSSLNIPMITAEPCKTAQGKNNEWEAWRKEAQAGIAIADMNIVMTPADRAYLETFIALDKISWLPPFIDTDQLKPADPLVSSLTPESLWADGCRLLSVGMMRRGTKMKSYQLLSKSLEKLRNENWSLVIAGSGPKMKEVRSLFARESQGRINIIGEKSTEEILLLMEHADIFAWPGINEAYGMVYLEAASLGLPSVAVKNPGVSTVVRHKQTGLLANSLDADDYAACLRHLMNAPGTLKQLGTQAKQFIANERSEDRITLKLRQIIDPVLNRYSSHDA